MIELIARISMFKNNIIKMYCRNRVITKSHLGCVSLIRSLWLSEEGWSTGNIALTSGTIIAASVVDFLFEKLFGFPLIFPFIFKCLQLPP